MGENKWSCIYIKEFVKYYSNKIRNCGFHLNLNYLVFWNDSDLIFFEYVKNNFIRTGCFTDYNFLWNKIYQEKSVWFNLILNGQTFWFAHELLTKLYSFKNILYILLRLSWLHFAIKYKPHFHLSKSITLITKGKCFGENIVYLKQYIVLFCFRWIMIIFVFSLPS